MQKLKLMLFSLVLMLLLPTMIGYISNSFTEYFIATLRVEIISIIFIAIGVYVVYKILTILDETL